VTGRTHQIRVHLAAGKTPVLGDPLYGPSAGIGALPGLALRAVGLAYQDPFTRRPVRIEAPTGEFLAEFGFAPPPAPASGDPAGTQP
jgi:23S rRNA pseudouridine1911/1915/1917 synthase